MCRQPSHLLNLQQSYKWTKHSKENYQSAIESQTIKLLLDKFIINTYPQNKVGINLALKDITDIFYQSASMCNLKKSSKRKPKSTNEKWFDDECVSLVPVCLPPPPPERTKGPRHPRCNTQCSSHPVLTVSSSSLAPSPSHLELTENPCNVMYAQKSNCTCLISFEMSQCAW